jgi:[protein-PII] uridylyltransferase
MPLLSQKRDLSDPLLIAEFAGRVGDHETLRELYLLSLVDTASVRPGNLTAWKLTLLDELYLQTRAQLRRGTIVARRHVVRRGEPENMPDRYYGLFHLDMRRQHGALVERLVAEDRNALLELELGSGALRLTLVARDRPGLLAQFTAILDDHAIVVLAADVFTSPGPPALAVDVFRVASAAGPEQGIDVLTITAIEQQLQEALPREALLAPPKRRVARPWSGAPRTETRIVFDSDPAGERTIVEVETEAGTDVLRRVTLAFAAEGLEILIARTGAEANRASNVFYVAALAEAAQQSLGRRLREYLR